MRVEGSDGVRLGLRERKKLMTRRAILDVAESMFAERGYDNVTVVEIADAVNIAPKTVFVYFPSKEDLVFDGEDDMRARVIARIRDRASGETPLQAMAGLLRQMMSESGSQAVEKMARMRRTVRGSAGLQARMWLMWERIEQELAVALARECGEDEHAPCSRVVAAQLVLIFRLLASDEVLGYVRSRPRDEQRAALEEWLETSIEMVGGGISSYPS